MSTSISNSLANEFVEIIQDHIIWVGALLVLARLL